MFISCLISASAQDMTIKQPIITEPVKTDPVLSQPRIEPQPVAPLVKAPMMTDVPTTPRIVEPPIQPPQTPPMDPIQTVTKEATQHNPPPIGDRPVFQPSKDSMLPPPPLKVDPQVLQSPPPRFASPEDFKEWAASLPPDQRQLMIERFKQMQVPGIRPLKGQVLPDKRLYPLPPDGSPDNPKTPMPMDLKDSPQKVTPPDQLKVPFKEDQAQVGPQEKVPRPGDVVGEKPDRGLVEERPRKGKLAEMAIGNPDAVRKKESPDIEKQMREPNPEKLKEYVYEKLKVPKDDRKKAIELKKEAMRLDKEGKKEEARQKEKDAEDLLPKVKIKSEREEMKSVKDIRVKRPDLAKEVKGGLNPDVKVEKRALRIEYKNASIDQTEFVYSVEPPNGGLSAFELVVEIPKDVANSVKDIDFKVQPDQVIKDDPVVKWMLKNIPQDKVAEYSFTVDGDVQNFDTLAVAAGDRPSVPQRIVNWFLDLFGFFD